MATDYLLNTGREWGGRAEFSRTWDFVMGTELKPFAYVRHNTGAFDYQNWGGGVELRKGGVYLKGEYADTNGFPIAAPFAVNAGPRAVVTLGVDL